MNAADFARYMADPSTLGSDSVAELSRVVEQFPYFQQAHVLLSLATRKWDTPAYQSTLKRTAIVVSNRSRLFELVQQQDRVPASAQPAAAQPAQVQSKEVVIDNAPEPQHKDPEVKTSEPAGSDPELAVLKAVEQVSEEEASAENDPRQLEEEIGRQVVRSFVEKEIIGTPELHKPVSKAPVNPGSFGDWLAYLKKNNGQPYHEIEREVREEKAREQGAEKQAEVTDRRQKNRAIMESIIEKNPGHIRVKEERFYTPEVKAKESLLENEHLVTETLAKIYALQGNTSKAIRAYQILSLKNPRKSAYFAALIADLKNQDKNEQQ